jgi:hypothetical protein
MMTTARITSTAVITAALILTFSHHIADLSCRPCATRWAVQGWRHPALAVGECRICKRAGMQSTGHWPAGCAWRARRRRRVPTPAPRTRLRPELVCRALQLLRFVGQRLQLLAPHQHLVNVLQHDQLRGGWGFRALANECKCHSPPWHSEAAFTCSGRRQPNAGLRAVCACADAVACVRMHMRAACRPPTRHPP